MIPITTYKNPVGVYGLGVSGMATIRALLVGGAQIRAWDDDAECRQAFAQSDMQADIILDPLETMPENLAALVVSPGMPLTHPQPHPVITRAKQANIPVIGDIGLFADALSAYDTPAPIIAITGTNGKSTTAALAAHLLAGNGFDVQLGGNIGQPVLDLNPPCSNTVYVLELSSYQIDLAPHFAPDIAVLLNLSPDHLDRHGSMENYIAAKWQLFTHLSPSSHVLIGLDDAASRACAARFAAEEPGKLTCFTTDINLMPDAAQTTDTASASDTAQPVDIAVDMKADIYVHKNLLSDNRGVVSDLSSIATLQGRHNWQNAAAAYGIARAVGVQRDALAESFADFTGLAHRMQPLGIFETVHFVNDSKATNAAATAHALSAFENIYWIAGGISKANGLAPLLGHLQQVKKAYLIGEAAAAFADQLAGHIPIWQAEKQTDNDKQIATLGDAVMAAAHDALAAGGGVVLLSPACASFDQFDNFAHRGAAFETAMQNFIADMSAHKNKKLPSGSQNDSHNNNTQNGNTQNSHAQNNNTQNNHTQNMSSRDMSSRGGVL